MIEDYKFYTQVILILLKLKFVIKDRYIVYFSIKYEIFWN